MPTPEAANDGPEQVSGPTPRGAVRNTSTNILDHITPDSGLYSTDKTPVGSDSQQLFFVVKSCNSHILSSKYIFLLCKIGNDANTSLNPHYSL